MTVLRSREIISPIRSPSKPKTLKMGSIIAPMTPSKALEPSNHPSHEATPGSCDSAQTSEPLGLGFSPVSGTSRRRSLRLISKASSEENTGNVVVSSRKRKSFGAENTVNVKDESSLESEEKEGVCGTDSKGFELGLKRARVSDRVRSKLRVSGDLVTEVGGEEKGGAEDVKSFLGEVSLVRDVGESESPSDFGNLSQSRKNVGSAKKGKGKRNSDVAIEFSASKSGGEGVVVEGRINLRSGKEIVKGSSGFLGVENSRDDNLVDESERKSKDIESGSPKGKRRYSREEKGKRKSVVDGMITELGINLNTNIDNSVSEDAHNLEIQPKEIENSPRTDENDTSVKRTRRFTREEKGKGEMVENDLLSNHIDAVDLDINMEPKVEKSIEDSTSGAVPLEGDAALHGEGQVLETNERANTARRFRDIARRNASRFAHFSSQVEEENNAVDEGEGEVAAPREADVEIEDWPGPFSTAWKIIRDRKTIADTQQENSCLDKSNPTKVNWVPRKDEGFNRKGLLVPSLLDLCMSILIKNADAITSLDGVPDILRHKLCHLLCDARKMNMQYLDLLVRGSPTEIRIRDCSWLAEEQFTTAFQGCEFRNLTVLQLDQCGRCLPDYTLLATLATSSNNLPTLTTISLKGACRLSDIGLCALVSSAPSLRSINLSQCSLVTSDGITRLADALGYVLRELYIDDCQGLNAILILPALTKLEKLEVLSVTGIESVCDDFVAQYVAVRGRHLKELNLTDCTKLTDSSLKAIAEYCPDLRSINLTNLCKLTDSAIGYLANGCQAIQTLKLCRNAFSDEAIAAYLETRGESLNDLSLNNVTKVAYNTAISLAKHSSTLVSLDLSWCRNLTNEALGLIVDSCLSLEVLKLFGCTQITNAFVNGHSNLKVEVIGLKMSPILQHIKVPELQVPLHYSSVPSST